MAFKTVVLKDDNGSEGFLLQTWESGSIAELLPGTCEAMWLVLSTQNKWNNKANKQQNKAEP